MTDRKRALLVCPGRGSYSRETLGALADRSLAASAVIAACDAWRTRTGEPTVSELDAADRFSAARHVAGEHASLLTFACTLADQADLSDRYEVCGVVGNSMGWYTALAAAGALSLRDAVRLVDTMGSYQRDNVIGAQLMVPVADPDWTPDPARRAAVLAAMAEATAAGGVAELSIDLGTFWVLGCDEVALPVLQRALPAEKRGAREFPARLPLHSAFHTSLLQATSDRARAELSDLRYTAPRVPLIDGRGRVFRPWSASPAELADYTLGHQVVRPYDLATSVLTALQHTGPDVIVLLGPGNSLGGPVASMIVAAGWRGLTDRASFDRLQATDPVLLSFGVPEQRAALVD